MNANAVDCEKERNQKVPSNMYGLLLINLQDYVTKVFGAKKYEEVRDALKIKDVRTHVLDFFTRSVTPQSVAILPYSLLPPLNC